MDSFIRDSNRHFIYFFVSADILFKNPEEFETLKTQTIVLLQGSSEALEAAGYRILNISIPENELAENISKLIQLEYSGQQNNPKSFRRAMMKTILSEREKEVLALIVKGLINKEIAMNLGISIPTVIFHRNNICEKLQTRSIGKLTVYAILQGIVEISEL
jgi:DNA-binding CsgD family transcriptional regulator